MKPELTLDALPQPGEPLTPHTDENNQKLIQDDIQERIKRQQARLTRRQRFWLNRRWNKLHKKLNRLGYNDLIVQRWETYQRYQELKHKIHETKDRGLLPEYEDVKERGKALNSQLADIKAIADEFEEVNSKLKAHDELIQWEREDKANFNAFLREARTWEQQLIGAFKQSPRLHHRYTDEKGRYIIDIPIIRKIVVKDDRVMYLIKTNSQNLLDRFFGRWHSALPYGVDVPDLVSDVTLKNLEASCGRVVTVERSKRGTNLYYVISRLDSPDGVPNKVLYQKAIDWYPTTDHSKTPWCAGVTNDRKVEWYNFEDNPHVLIAGATKGGKSNHVNQMIATMVTMNTPQELRLLLVDLKGGIEFTHWKGLQHQLRPMLTSPTAVLEGLQWLRSIMETRLEAFESMKAKNLTSYNEKAKQKLPRIVCLVDEMATLIGLGDLTHDLHTELRVLSAQGRAVGINLVLCTQHSSVDVLPGWVKTNMGLRVSAKMPSHQASMVILDSITASTLPNVPGRMVFSSGRFEIIAQSPFISDEQIASSIKVANGFKNPDNTEFISVLPKPEPAKPPFGRNEIIKMALEMNGHLSERRIHDIVGNEVMPLRKIRVIINEIKDEWERGQLIEFEGNDYTIERKGRAYHLVMQQSMQQETPTDTVAS